MVTKKHSERNQQVTTVPYPQSPSRAGMTRQWAGGVNNVPSGWLMCDGQEVSRTEYADLFAAIGERYGSGDGSTTFNLPSGPWRTHKFDMSFTTGPAGTVTIGDMVITRDRLGNYRTEFDFVANLDSATFAPFFGVRGITFDGRDNQAFAINQDNSNAYSMNRAITTANSNTFTLVFSNSVDALSARVNALLQGRPTDDVVIADSRFDTLDDAWDSVPIIKAYNDQSGVAVSDALATSDAPGNIQLDSSFGAQAGQWGLVRPAKTQYFTIPINISNPSDTDALFTFNNLTVGQRYLFMGQIGFSSLANSNLDIGPVGCIESLLWRLFLGTNTDNTYQYFPVNFILEASATTITISALSNTSGSVTVLGRLSGRDRSYIRITEATDQLWEQTSEYT